MIKLGVNIDHCATLRQARYRQTKANSGVIIEPDILQAAFFAENGGADSITAHLREDRRHMNDADLAALRKGIVVPLNMEMACTLEILKIALRLKPDYICMVPENRAEVTTEGGLDVIAKFEDISAAVDKLSKKGVVCSLFIDPCIEQVEAAAKSGAQSVELHTGAFANAWGNVRKKDAQKKRIAAACAYARSLGLTVNAGHGINYLNAREVVELGDFNEFNIGHSIICRALAVGLSEAVAEMKELINS